MQPPDAMETLSNLRKLVVASLVLSIQHGASGDGVLDRKSPQDLLPGLIARAYLGGSSNAKKFPTHLLAVVQTGKVFIDRYKPMAQDELRGVAKTEEIYYVASGYIIVDMDHTTVAFDVGDANCTVGGKDFGRKSYTHEFKKGRYPIEITRAWGHGQGDFSVVDAGTKRSVLFHTDEMLAKELGHSVKVGGKTFKSKDLSAPAKP